MISQCKGKELDKVPKSKLDEGEYIFSKKYDGNYVQIHKIGDVVTFYSSGGISFHLEPAKDLVQLNKGINFILETEYIGLTDGSMGSRGQCTTTTFRTRSKKGQLNNPVGVKFKVFDCLYYHEEKYIDYGDFFDQTYGMRIDCLSRINLGSLIDDIFRIKLSLAQGVETAKYLCEETGAEGLFGVKEGHLYRPGKRVNDAIKLKFYHQMEMVCLDAEHGDGQFDGVIASLTMFADGHKVKVGGVIVGRLGISDKNWFKGKKYIVVYESFDKTFIQPRFKNLNEQ